MHKCTVSNLYSCIDMSFPQVARNLPYSGIFLLHLQITLINGELVSRQDDNSIVCHKTILTVLAISASSVQDVKTYFFWQISLLCTK